MDRRVRTRQYNADVQMTYGDEACLNFGVDERLVPCERAEELDVGRNAHDAVLL